MSGTKTTEFTLDETTAQVTEEFIMNTAVGTARVPRFAMPGAGVEVFVAPVNSPLTLTQEAHEGKSLDLSNATGAIVVNLPDVNTVWPNVADIDGTPVQRGGIFCSMTVASPDFPVSIVSTGGTALRSKSARNPSILTASTVFVGANRALSDEATVYVMKRGGLWQLESSAGFRLADGDFVDRSITVTAEVGRQFTNDDNGIPVWLTAVAPGTLSFQSDIATGTQITAINQGASPATINFGGHTQLGDASIPAGQAASIVVGPVTTGVNKDIFVAASS